jgi:hypothetical protein
MILDFELRIALLQEGREFIVCLDVVLESAEGRLHLNFATRPSPMSLLALPRPLGSTGRGRTSVSVCLSVRF